MINVYFLCYICKPNLDINETKDNKVTTAMKKIMFGIPIRNNKSKKWIGQRTKVTDAANRVSQLKWNFAGAVARIWDRKWNIRILQWRPWNKKENRGRPLTRWYVDIK